jgi:hypothetical protein
MVSTMKATINRRDFSKALAIGLGAAAAPALLAAEPRKIKIGDTCLVWNVLPLDGSKDQPLTPLETAQITKAYLEKLGYEFRA